MAIVHIQHLFQVMPPVNYRDIQLTIKHDALFVSRVHRQQITLGAWCRCYAVRAQVHIAAAPWVKVLSRIGWQERRTFLHHFTGLLPAANQAIQLEKLSRCDLALPH